MCEKKHKKLIPLSIIGIPINYLMIFIEVAYNTRHI